MSIFMLKVQMMFIGADVNFYVKSPEGDYRPKLLTNVYSVNMLYHLLLLLL